MSGVKSMFEISEMTEKGKQVYEIVENGEPQSKFIIVDVHEWEAFERWQALVVKIANLLQDIWEFVSMLARTAPWKLKNPYVTARALKERIEKVMQELPIP